MSRPVRLYPGSDPSVFSLSQWADIIQDPSSTELWIMLHRFDVYHLEHGADRHKPDWQVIESASTVVVFDWFHADPGLEDFDVDWVRQIAAVKPLTWITLNPKPISDLRTIRFDYYWNRTKQAFWDKNLIHKLYGIENFEQYPLHSEPRSHKYLHYHLRSDSVKNQVRQHLSDRHHGFYNDFEKGIYLDANSPLPRSRWEFVVAPPSRWYFDQSYVTCLVESQYRGTNGYVISEKTYDHLIQGRPVLNFAPPGFYQQLTQDGWQLPQGIDWSWNDIVDDDHRLQAYLDQVDDLLSRPMHVLHQWFMDNWSVWQHNHSRLETKPYDIIDFSSI
jgi:hypothetical protein